MLVELGLDQVHQARIDPATQDTVRDEAGQVVFDTVDGGPRVLEIRVPDTDTLGDAFRTITAPQGVTSYHTPGTPTWVHCPDRPQLAALLADHYGCNDGRPADVETTHWTAAGPPGVGPDQPATA